MGWLADANLAVTNSFGLTYGADLGTYPSDASGYHGVINADGTMNWPGARFWIDAMNADGGAGYLGYNDWRLPTTAPVNGTNFQLASSNNGTSDWGTAKTTTNGSDGGWRDGAGNPVSEMGYMYYVNLANLGLHVPNDASPTSTIVQAGWGLANVGPFSNVNPTVYWSGREYTFAPGSIGAWGFDFSNGYRYWWGKNQLFAAWAVRSGDVAVPEPASLGLVGTTVVGLLGLGWRRRRR